MYSCGQYELKHHDAWSMLLSEPPVLFFQQTMMHDFAKTALLLCSWHHSTFVSFARGRGGDIPLFN